MGYGLASRGSGMTLADLAASCDVFYIGGDQGGALFGRGGGLPPAQRPPGAFMTAVKQRGALLAKGWLLGVQFDALFTDGLYQKLGKNAIETAERLERGIPGKRGSPSIWTPPPTRYSWWWTGPSGRTWPGRPHSAWEQLDEERTVIRFVTSWATLGWRTWEELIRRL